LCFAFASLGFMPEGPIQLKKSSQLASNMAVPYQAVAAVGKAASSAPEPAEVSENSSVVVNVVTNDLSPQQRGWLTKQSTKHVVDKAMAAKTAVENGKMREKIALEAMMIEFKRKHPYATVRDIGATFGVSKSRVARVVNGSVTYETTTKGGRPSNFSQVELQEVARQLAYASSDNAPLSGRDAVQIARSSFRANGANVNKQEPSSGTHLRKMLAKANPGANLKSRPATASEKARDEACNPQNCYDYLMELKCHFQKASGSNNGIMESHRVIFADETCLSMTQREASSVSSFGVSANRSNNNLTDGHTSSLTIFSANGVILLKTTIFSGKPLVKLEGGPPAAFAGSVMFTNTGSMRKSDKDKPHEVSPWYYTMEQLIERLGLLYGPKETRGRFFFIIDSAPCHIEHNAFQLLSDNNVDVVRVRAHTSSVLQVSDNHELHGRLQVAKRTFFAQLARGNQGDLSDEQLVVHLESLVQAAFSPMNIHHAVEQTGFVYVANSGYTQVTVNDQSALAFVKRLADKGVFDHHLSMKSTSALRCDKILALDRCISEGILPPHTRSLIDPNSLAAMNATRLDLSHARQVELADKKARKRSRRVAIQGIQLEGREIMPETYLMNSATLQKGRREAQEANLAHVAESLKKRADRTAKKARKAEEDSAQALRLGALRERFKELDDLTFATSKRSVSKYLLGKSPDFDLAWAVGKVQAKLVPVSGKKKKVKRAALAIEKPTGPPGKRAKQER
jgi:hypothetical protein